MYLVFTPTPSVLKYPDVVVIYIIYVLCVCRSKQITEARWRAHSVDYNVFRAMYTRFGSI